MSKSAMSELLLLMAEYHKEDLSPARLAMFCEDLKPYDIEKVKRSWAAFRMDPKNKFMPTPSQIVDNFQDGRPSAQEAWAMVPKNEDKSVVWCEEMRMAFGDSHSLLQSNPNGAFFVFKESYDRRVRRARYDNQEPKWSVSFGFSVAGRSAAVKEAVDKGRLSFSQAKLMLPEAFTGGDVVALPERVKNLLDSTK